MRPLRLVTGRVKITLDRIVSEGNKIKTGSYRILSSGVEIKIRSFGIWKELNKTDTIQFNYANHW
jgi:hypothetical protein